jgi:hypothetical protein
MWDAERRDVGWPEIWDIRNRIHIQLDMELGRIFLSEFDGILDYARIVCMNQSRPY